LEKVRLRHQEDLQMGFGAVYLPGALDRKYPKADREWSWPRKSLRSTRFLN